MKKVIITIGVILLAFGLYAQKSRPSGSQPYSSAFNGRIELNSNTTFLGVTYKHYTDAFKSYEIMALTDFDNGIEFYGQYQYNGMIPDFPPKLRWFIGGGAHVGTWSGWNDDLIIGLNGILGVEYTFDEIPLNLGLDWKPLLNLVTEKHDRFWPSKFGISIRYVIK